MNFLIYLIITLIVSSPLISITSYACDNFDNALAFYEKGVQDSALNTIISGYSQIHYSEYIFIGCKSQRRLIPGVHLDDRFHSENLKIDREWQSNVSFTNSGTYRFENIDCIYETDPGSKMSGQRAIKQSLFSVSIETDLTCNIQKVSRKRALWYDKLIYPIQ